MNEEKRTVNEANEEILVQKAGNGYILAGTEGTIGEITYKLVDVNTWIIDHTYVDPRYRGRNFARQLLDLVVEEARANGRKIIPACSYALAQFKRNSEYADVWLKTEAQYSDIY